MSVSNSLKYVCETLVIDENAVLKVTTRENFLNSPFDLVYLLRLRIQ